MKLPPPPAIASILREIRHPHSSATDEGALSWRLFTEILSRTGLRARDLWAVTKSDVTIGRDMVVILAGRRRVPIPDVIREAFSELHKKSVNSNIFESMLTGRRILLGQKWHSKKWTTAARRVWPDMSMHMWRHYAWSHVNDLYGPYEASRVLGHRRIDPLNERFSSWTIRDFLNVINRIP